MRLEELTGTVAELPKLIKLRSALRAMPVNYRDCIAKHMETTAAKFQDQCAIVSEGRELTWGEFNALCNRFAKKYKSLGLKRGDSVSLVMENRIEFLACFLALNKLGVAAALVNSNLAGKAMQHSLLVTGARVCIFGSELTHVIDAFRHGPGGGSIERFLFVPDTGADPCPAWATDMTAQINGEDPGNPPDTAQNTAGDLALYVFTSGTTGLPKAAVIPNRRVMALPIVSALVGLRCKENDRIYLCLPLYHATGLLGGAGAAFLTGASLFLRRRFSATSFLPEVRDYQVTHFVYIGELCRYLTNTPRRDDDHSNPLKTVFGNGLRPDVWDEFKSRFGIQRVSEFYGSSEGNVGFLNVFNRDHTVGTTTAEVALVRYSIVNDRISRNESGFCSRATGGEPGLLLGKVTAKTPFEGYTDRKASEKKILRDVFEEGDAWFDTGDLMRTVDVGFAFGLKHYQFVDRVGDTFRWKSENVSTSEVEEVLSRHPQVAVCNVYGVEVPGSEGRAGMAALQLIDSTDIIDLAGIAELVNRELAPYARPIFLRVLSSIETTSTFKTIKGKLREDAFDPDRVQDIMYIMKPGSLFYELLDESLARSILAGKGTF